MGFSRQEYWSVLPSCPPGDLPYPGIEPASLTYISCIGTWVLYYYCHLVSPRVWMWRLLKGTERQEIPMRGDAHFSRLPAIACAIAIRTQWKAYQTVVLTSMAPLWCFGWTVHIYEAEQGSFAGSLSLSWATLDLDELVWEGEGEAGKRWAVISLPASCCRRFWARTAPWRPGCT